MTKLSLLSLFSWSIRRRDTQKKGKEKGREEKEKKKEKKKKIK
jgi:hypothetical protein